MRLRNTLLFLLFSSCLLPLLTGCGAPPIPASTGSRATLSGSVHGGQQPVAGASIQLYAVGLTATPSAATPLLTQPVLTTADGSFNITGLYTCPAGSLVYITATGGNPGLSAVNPSLAEMAALGPCASLSSSTFISLNEVTTVAAVSALAPFMSSLTAVGSSSADSPALAAAFTLAAQFASTASGSTPGSGIPAGTTIPSARINTLADVIAACVNSTGGSAYDGSRCGQLFALATPGSAAPPTNTVAALLNIAANPGLNPAALFALVTPAAPFQPALTTAPPDFRIAPSPSTPAVLQLSTASLLFPGTAVGTPTPPQPLTLTNLSTSPVSLTTLALTGANAVDFAVTSACPAMLQPGVPCTLQLVLTPSAAGSRIASLVLATSASAAPQYVTLLANNPTPLIYSITPASIPAGTQYPTFVTVAGNNFTPSSIIQINGVSQITSYYNPFYLSLLLNPAALATPVSDSVTVLNPLPGGGVSAPVTLTIAPTPAPTLQPVTTPFYSGTPTTSLTLFGTNLGPSDIVTWNGTPLTVQYAYSTFVGVTLPAALLSTAGTATLTLTSPTALTPGNSVSIPVSVVDPPAPTLTALSTTSGPVATPLTLQLTGQSFTGRSTVTLNGVAVPTTWLSSSSLSTSVPAAVIAAPNNYQFAVTTSGPGGGVSSSLPYTAYVPFTSNSLIYNPANGLLYLSVPSSAGAPYGNSIVSMDPQTGALGTPIPVGAEPNKLALTADGRFLWVGLDGPGAVRKVDLTTGTAGLQFSLVPIANAIGPVYAASLAALPGASDSVVVSAGQLDGSGSSFILAIFDSGVIRGRAMPLSLSIDYYETGAALQVDPIRSEIYIGQLYNFTTASYSANGITAIASFPGPSIPSTYPYYANSDELTLLNGALYTNFGHAYNAETGANLLTLYSSGTTVVQGPTNVDSTLNRIFVLDSPVAALNPQLRAFNLDGTATGAPAVPVYIPAFYSYGSTPAHLVRWGANGLAFRTANAIFSLTSSAVQDLASTSADLGVSVASTGSTTTGGSTTYTATVSNAGPATATSITLSAALPVTGTLVSATNPAGVCTGTTQLACNLGSLASGASATVTVVVSQRTPGTAAFTAQAYSVQSDPSLANNQASLSTTITGNPFSPPPTLAAISPAVVPAGSSDTTLTLTGTGFTTASTVLLAGAPLPTSFVSATQLTATVPASAIAALGWQPISVSTPAPGGGLTPALPLSVYSVLALSANHVVYEPFSRRLFASIGAAAATSPNSILPIDPQAGSTGTALPAGDTPSLLGITSDGQYLYSILTTANSIARFNLATGQQDFAVPFPLQTNTNLPHIGLFGFDIQPGSDTTLFIVSGTFLGAGLYDFDPVAKIAARRGQIVEVGYESTCPRFIDAGNLLYPHNDISGTVDSFTVSASGLTQSNTPHIFRLLNRTSGCAAIAGGLASFSDGGVINPYPTPLVELGAFPISNQSYAANKVTPDPSLGRTFFLSANYPSGLNAPNSIVVYDQASYLQTGSIPLAPASFGTASPTLPVDLVRWGQDGLAALTSDGRLYLVRGPAVVPQLLTTNTPATLTAASTVTHGTGNTLLTLTGSNFVPGVAVLFNGSYRTTTILDATHLSVALPASDLAAPGSATLTAVNPGASPSAALTLPIQ